MARVLIVGGGERGLSLARRLVAEGHALRITTRTERRRQAIEATGAECWIGTPDRLATLRGALEHVTVACWLLATATGTEEQTGELETSRLEFFLGQVIDSTVRGFIYETPVRSSHGEPGERGAQIARRLTARNVIPLRLVEADPASAQWLVDAHAAVSSVLE